MSDKLNKHPMSFPVNDELKDIIDRAARHWLPNVSRPRSMWLRKIAREAGFKETGEKP